MNAWVRLVRLLRRLVAFLFHPASAPEKPADGFEDFFGRT